jgi:hypothetical protein
VETPPAAAAVRPWAKTFAGGLLHLRHVDSCIGHHKHRTIAMLPWSAWTPGPLRDLDFFFALQRGFDKREQRLLSGGQFRVVLSYPRYQRDQGSLFRDGRGLRPPTSSALSVSARKLSTITFSARRNSRLATMPVVLTGQVNSATT